MMLIWEYLFVSLQTIEKPLFGTLISYITCLALKLFSSWCIFRDASYFCGVKKIELWKSTKNTRETAPPSGLFLLWAQLQWSLCFGIALNGYGLHGRSSSLHLQALWIAFDRYFRNKILVRWAVSGTPGAAHFHVLQAGSNWSVLS